MREDLTLFKDKVLLRRQNSSSAEAQTRIADLELACFEVKDMQTEQKMEMQDKIFELERHCMRNIL